jgi:hypothetical protein
MKHLIAPTKKHKKKKETSNGITLNNICTKGAQLLTKFRLINLNVQVRAAEDIQQMQTLDCLRSFNDNQVSESFLKSIVHNNTLNEKDFDIDTSRNEMSWTSAQLAVTSNTERDNLMYVRAQKWAQENGVPIITWKLQCRGTVMNFIKDDNVLHEIYHAQSGLLGYFVQGAMSYLTENINPSKGLANGNTVYMHSLSFSDEDIMSSEYKTFLTMYDESQPGEEVHLKKIIPTFINVEIIMTAALKKYWNTSDTIVPNKYVVPIGFRSRPKKIILDIKVHDHMYNNITLLKDKEHRVELSFVITLHKLQGKTMPKLIIELNERPFPPSITYNGLLVALSRVTKRSDLRIMPIKSGCDILYLKKLKPDINLKIWLGGFDNEGNWKRHLCKEFYDHITKNTNCTNTSKNKIKSSPQNVSHHSIALEHKTNVNKKVASSSSLQEICSQKISSDNISTSTSAISQVTKLTAKNKFKKKKNNLHLLHQKEKNCQSKVVMQRQIPTTIILETKTTFLNSLIHQMMQTLQVKNLIHIGVKCILNICETMRTSWLMHLTHIKFGTLLNHK